MYNYLLKLNHVYVYFVEQNDAWIQNPIILKPQKPTLTLTD